MPIYQSCKRAQCFAEKNGACMILTDTHFKDKPCPFFKTAEQIEREKVVAAQREGLL